MAGWKDKAMLGFIAAGLAGGASTVTQAAGPYLINGSGATLLQDLFRVPASTNDFIDVDANGVSTSTDPFNSQLAPFDSTPPFSNYWQVTYRVVGSINGFQEMRDWGLPGIYLTTPDGTPGSGTLESSFSDESLWNRSAFVTAGVLQPLANASNPAGSPVRSLDDGTFRVTTSTVAPAGIHIDFSSLDVPVSWAINQSGTPKLNAVPGAPGYGSNPRTAVNKDGTSTVQDNLLASLVGLNGNINVDTANPNANTVFDTAINLAPVAAPVNYGVGMSQILMSDLRHGFATGRRMNGENLEFITRDSGSGTRNAFANGICLDPSWCVGENIGDRTVSSANDRLGPNYQPSNKGGSSRVEGTAQNHRLAIGHTGAERGESSGWLVGSDRLDLLAVKSDLKGGTQFVRPTNVSTLNGGPDGYNITGPAVIATIGDPRGLPSSGMFDGATVNFGGDNNGNPAPQNPMVGAYVNNITRSISAFVSAPADAANVGSPGEYLATQFVLVAAAEFVPQSSGIDPSEDCIPLVANPDFNAALNNFSLNDPNNVLSLPEFATFDSATAGNVPNRTTGVVYSDGNAGAHYVAQDGTLLLYGTSLNQVNKISYDANSDGVRDINDAAALIAAATDPAWRNTEAISPEILFDGDGDGNFTAEDVRYWADGLAMVSNTTRGVSDLDPSDYPLVLDRKAGFVAVDFEFGGNFFGTSLATPKSYANGDSRGDVAGDLPTRGWAPNGWDGLIDANDIDYVYANFGDWTDTFTAVSIDLSADMNGDLVVDQADVCELVIDILGTSFGDVNLDGVVDGSDTSIISGNIGNAGGWADGDMDGDGQVTQADLDIANGLVDPCVVCPADLSGDGTVDGADLAALLAAWGTGNAGGDLNGDGNTDGADLAALLAAWGLCS